MKKLLTVLSIALVMISSGVSDLLCETGVRTFTEDFSSDNYLDLANSSARWEPARGDLRLPAYQIERLGSYSTPGKAWNVLFHDFRLYVSNGYSGVQVYDLSENQEVPKYIGFYDAPGNVQNVFIAGDSIYVACGQEGYKIINRALLYAPAPSPESDDRNFVKSEFLQSTEDMLNYISPGNNILGAPLINAFTFDIEVARDSLAVVAQWDSVKIVRIKSRNRRNIYDIIDGKVTPSGAMEVRVIGAYIFLIEHNFGLRVLSFADIDAVLGEYPVPGKSYGFDISGDYLYLAAGESGLYTLDISTPESPSLVSSFDTELDAVEADGYAVDVTIAGDYAYVSEWGEAVVVVDISDPANPVLAGFSDLEDPLEGVAVNWPWGVAINDTTVYVADYTGGVKVLRASPSYDSSSYVGRSLPISEGINEISRVKLDTEQSGTVTWRVSADGGSNWQEIEPDNNWYLLDAPGGQLIWESTHYPAGGWSPSNCSSLSIQYEGAVATLLSESDAVFDESAVRVSWSLIDVDEGVSFIIMRSNYPEDRFARLAVVDANGELNYSYDDKACESGSTYHYRVYLEDGENQTLLFNSGPVTVPLSMLSLYQNEPNPFNPSTRIKYNLPERTRVALNIYDVSGRLVKTLVEKVQEKGPHSVVWNGRDNAGRAVSSGVYFYTLNSEAGNLTRKLVLLR